jgi:hypothetical protein
MSGIDAGRQEALRVTQDVIKPELISFFSVLESMAAYHQLVSETAIDEAVKLAFLIAEIILPCPLSTNPQTMGGQGDDLRKKLADAYRLRLEIHPDALKDLEQIMDGSQVGWPDQQAIHIHGENTLPDDGINVQFMSAGHIDLTSLLPEDLSGKKNE